MQKNTYAIEHAEQTMMAAIDEAIDQAVKTAGHELRSLGSHRSPHDYYADAALRQLFLRLCGADQETNTGGDPEFAWKLLYMGRAVARHWERERGNPAALRKKKERQEDLEKDVTERRELTHSAQKFALNTAIRVLVEHASVTDPKIRDRLLASTEAYIARLEPESDTGREFAERVRSQMSILATPPES